MRNLCAVTRPSSYATASHATDSGDLYPAMWGLLRGASPGPRAAAWAERLRGKAAANAVRNLLAGLPPTMPGWRHVAHVPAAGIQALTIDQDVSAIRVQIHLEMGDHLFGSQQVFPLEAGVKDAAGRAYLCALERAGVLLETDGLGTGPWEVRLADEAVHALTCRALAPGLRPRWIESWRLGLARGAQSSVNLATVPAGDRCGSLALVHWAGPPASASAMIAWSVAARRAAARAGLTDAHEWAILPVFGGT